MKNILIQLIDDFHERELPVPVKREHHFAELDGKADVVIWMRRSGRTWFCFQKIDELIASGINKSQILYLNFEDDRLLEFRAGHFDDILNVYFGKYPENKSTPCYFFFDEIQRIDNWELFIRRLIDTENARIFVAGSSSKLLGSEIATSLRGRALSTEIFPFSFQEFLTYHEVFPERPKTFGSKTVSLLRKAAREYLNTGGFPEIQNVDQNLRIEILQGYISSVLLKDIVERHKVSNVQVLKYLVRHIMNSSGGKFSTNKFYNTMKSISVKCTKNNLYSYIDYLVDAFLFYKVPIHSRSEKSRLVNPAKIYTIDTGLLNAMIFRNSNGHGPLLENLVFMHLRRKGFEVEYVISKEGYETDFLAWDKISKKNHLIQVCWEMAEQETFERELRGLKAAMEELSISSGTVVTWDDEISLEGNIEVVPCWKWLLAELS